MVCSPSVYMPEHLLLESSYAKMAVIDSCYESINEDLGNQFVVSKASSYTQSMIFEILDNVKNSLVKLCQQVLSYLNNYILNTANLADKYRNLIIERYDKLEAPLMYKTYTYPKLKGNSYPNVIKSSTDLENQIREMQETIVSKHLTAEQSGELVDKMLVKFSKDVIGSPVSVFDLRQSAREIVYDHIRGRARAIRLDKGDLDEFITEIRTYKEMKDEIIRTRNDTIKYYEMLKRVYSGAMIEPLAKAEGLNIKSLRDPEAEDLKATDYQRFANINLQMTRLFNGYITIYSEAYNAKINVLKEKIDANRAIIVELLTRTGVFAAINTKSPSKTRKPYTFDPSLKM